MRMSNYIVFRLISIISQIFGVSILLFVLYFFMNYNPAVAHNAFSSNPKVAIKQEEVLLGIDKSIFDQFINYWNNLIFHQTFGLGWEGSTFHKPLDAVLWESTINTLFLFFGAFFLYVFLGVVIGLVSGSYANTPIDFILRFFTNFTYAVPSVLLAIYLFRYLVSITGLITFDQYNRQPVQNLNFQQLIGSIMNPGSQDSSAVISYWQTYGYLLIIVISLVAVISSTFLARQIRALTIVELRKPYVNTAKAKGLKFSIIIRKHVVPNLNPKIMTSIGATVPVAITTSAIVEFVFGYPGLANLMIESAKSLNVPILMAGTLVLTFVSSLLVSITDILAIWFDPRRD